jgi:hypothetical protein
MTMPPRVGAAAVFLLGAAMAVSAATSNLNLSKSNIYRLTYDATIVSEAQVKAMLAELDSLGPMDAERLKQWLPANFKRFGIEPRLVKKTLVLPPGQAGREAAIILLSNPADEAKALATAAQATTTHAAD